MTYKIKIAATILAASMPMSALAAPINALGTYDIGNVTYANEPVRGIWTEGASDGLVTGGTASRYWDVEYGGGGTFTLNNDFSATVSGIATNISTDGSLNTDLQFAYNLEYTFEDDLANNPQAGFCQYQWPVNPCSDPSTPANVDVSVWDFFYLDSGTFEFLGGYAGVNYAITDRSNGVHKGQAGVNANALVADDGLGFSMWYNATATSMPSFSTYTFASSDDGDINVNIFPTAVPLPAAGWMLVAGLGGLAAMKRRKKA